MEAWFGKTVDQSFTAFSTSHWIMLIVYFSGVAGLLLTHKQISNHPSIDSLLRWIFVVILVLSEISYQVWAITNNVWSFADHMPLHLCGIASFIAVAALISKNEQLIQISIFIGIVPAFLALITPVLPHGYEHFRFWKFFVHHIFISWSSIYLLLTYHVKIRFFNMLTVFLYLVIYGVFVGVWINPSVGSNYLYLSHQPNANTPLDMLGSGIWYYVNLGIITFSVFSILVAVQLWIRRNDEE
ncbi:TIGR02206 family membrane protein [Radiobacillus sp. PE A8.2]|uniref:YwaF family protein n=1 Tax=Radiobacillus sp. PE A8.2 TaxID=3380349 RepID=UPI00389066D0